MLGTDGQLVRGVSNPGAARVAFLRRVRGVYGRDPAAVLRHVVGEPPDKRATVPAPVLHRVSNPA